MSQLRTCIALAATLLAGCGADTTTATATPFPIRVDITNSLVAPVTIAVDGAPAVILSPGRGSPLTVLSTAKTLTWTSGKPTDVDGRQIPDEIGEVSMPVAGLGPTLDITNVINGQTYVTANVINHTNARVTIGVANGSTVACAGVLDPAAFGIDGFVRIGYYRLLATTELRAYRDSARCVGAYTAWPAGTLTHYAPKTGNVALVLDAAP